MVVSSIIHESIVDGEGLRTVLFFAGCPHQCFGCHNPSTWSINNGVSYTVEDLMEEIEKYPHDDVTLSGGEPFFQAEAILPLAKRIKGAGKNLWIYTGYTWSELLQRGSTYELELLLLADVIVDGPFILKEMDVTLPFRGSKNQHIIRINSLEREEVEERLNAVVG
ncbi:anaerobic ribonucleoside-triphosphate reductase activating protein [Evansella sp. AB-rgal1]|uniref:anaerobic ribonucleoside-triphosphate reductase activating protein n=1 Tax=Evansella sp. AB-rgal1 TaxID=3242696 RepID=UPI00359EB139